MGYFSNGTEGDFYETEWCNHCVHQSLGEGCAVWSLHLLWNYEQVGKSKVPQVKSTALETFIPTQGVHNGPCKMFYRKPEKEQVIILTGEEEGRGTWQIGYLAPKGDEGGLCT